MWLYIAMERNEISHTDTIETAPIGEREEDNISRSDHSLCLSGAAHHRVVLSGLQALAPKGRAACGRWGGKRHLYWKVNG